MSAVDLFREKYQYINEETLDKASKENPSLILNLLKEKSINQITLGLCLISLASTEKEEYFELINSYIENDSAFVRESSFMALSYYFNDEDPKFNQRVGDILKERIKHEKSEGVLKRINEILNQMEFYMK